LQQFLRPDLTLGEHYDIITNPDFLREGYALHDFVTPERLVIGMDQNSKKAKNLIENLYSTIISSGTPIIYTNYETAELIKYATTAFIVTKSSLMNEVSDLCGKTGANVDHLIMGVGLDSYVGPKLLNVTPGFGGLAYPALMRGIIRTARTLGMECHIMQAVMENNANRAKSIAEHIIGKLHSNNGLSNKKVSILGMTCKPHTNDVKEAPSICVIHSMLENDVSVSAYDPSLRLDEPRTLLTIPKTILNHPKFQLTGSVYEAVEQSDMVVIMTDWAEFLSIDFEKVWELMKRNQNANPILMDTYNIYAQAKLRNFEYIPAEEILDIL
jgi:UDPglucose 6-dehydrogenase